MSLAKSFTVARKTDNLLISFFVCLLIVACLLQTSSQEFAHWFLIPVTLCGIVIGTDAISWILGKVDLFDPIGFLGLIGFHFFFIAPLWHVSQDVWTVDVHPPDWRPWLGGMAILNLLGLFIYRFTRRLSFNKPKENRIHEKVWLLDYKKFPIILGIALIISAGLQILVYQYFGGIIGYINSSVLGEDKDKFQGFGIVFLVSESFPTLAMMGFAAYAQRSKKKQSWFVLAIVLLVFFVLQLFFGGLRGSRSNTVWALYVALGIIHFWIRSITKKHLAIFFVFLMLFMYVYGFFKAGGIEGLQTALEGSASRAALERESGRTVDALFLGDLGRSDLQALLLQRIMRHDSDYDYALGRTYYAAVSILVPGLIWPDKPPSKTLEGTNAMYGDNSYAPGAFVSSKVYGLAGETMLNFGPFLVPLSFAILGVLVGRVRYFLLNADPSDSRLLIFPRFVIFCFTVLSSDLDNDIFFLIKDCSFPLIVILISSRMCHRVSLPPHSKNTLL